MTSGQRLHVCTLPRTERLEECLLLGGETLRRDSSALLHECRRQLRGVHAQLCCATSMVTRQQPAVGPGLAARGGLLRVGRPRLSGAPVCIAGRSSRTTARQLCVRASSPRQQPHCLPRPSLRVTRAAGDRGTQPPRHGDALGLRPASPWTDAQVTILPSGGGSRSSSSCLEVPRNLRSPRVQPTRTPRALKAPADPNPTSERLRHDEHARPPRGGRD